MQHQTNPQLQLAFNYLQFTNQNVFLTGKAGTGKTTFLRNLKLKSPKRMIVVAPTGVAAINAGGVTIHSFFQISFGPQIPIDPNSSRQVDVEVKSGNVSAGIKRFNRDKINIIRSLDLLVIDEISMVRADLLDAIDEVLRRYKNKYLPFGGVQLLMIGDLQQLSPVVKDEEWSILKTYYENAYFFSSRALKRSQFIGIELTHIFRQSDQRFIKLLNNVRENNVDSETLQALNSRYIPNFDPDESEGYITLTTHNYQAQTINDEKLSKLNAKMQTFKAEVEGDFPEYSYPTDFQLSLKVGAQVMFVKNDSSPEKRYYNGRIGKITGFDDPFIDVLCPGETNSFKVAPEEWQNTKYALNEQTQEIDETVVGKFTQFPLKLAWAITIHKSQGLTFEKAIINASLSFAHGQVYVALSRCKTIEGLVLSEPIRENSVKSDTTVLKFTTHVEQNQPGENEFIQSRRHYQFQLITELFDFKQLAKYIQYLLKDWTEEAAHIQGNIGEILKKILPSMQTELILVSDKFQPFLIKMLNQNPDAESNVELQDRIVKGSIYFENKFNEIVFNPISKLLFQTDNKAIRKKISDGVSKIEKEIDLKMACLKQSQKGFAIKTFLETKSKAMIEKPDIAKINNAINGISSLQYPEFYNILLAWRRNKANELNIEIGNVIRQNVLLSIAQIVPTTVADLKGIKGMGGTKTSQFGRDLLKLAVEFKKKEGLDVSINFEKEVDKVGKNTKTISFEMFKSGLSIEEVAAERKFAASTIFGHLRHFVETGEIDPTELIDSTRLNAIVNYLETNDSKSANDIRAAIGEEYSYDEIWIANSYLKFKNS